MFKSNNTNLYDLSLLFLITLSIPFLISGPFIPDLFFSIAAIMMLTKILLQKKYIFINNRYFIFFIIFSFYLILNSLFSDFLINSLQSSLFYFRFGFFVICFYYLYLKFDNILNYFFYFFTFTISIILIDSFFQIFLNIHLFTDGTFNSHGIYGRYSGIFGEELKLGSFLIKILFIYLSLIIYQKNLNNFLRLYSYIITIFSKYFFKSY